MEGQRDTRLLENVLASPVELVTATGTHRIIRVSPRNTLHERHAQPEGKELPRIGRLNAAADRSP